ncbi:PKD domain-containing protein [Methanospirillum lacunae]|uniref:PKD domain-containing protein n=1 Tax=Methanospirillum lacunae TaxID=668570 RepID=A0A2V2MZX3_9EURY|nr:PKD domain-containing protein [Methanospirillum lacunae]PWR69848.1 hypothetical protein DK846_16865 [Methanospirillum lacunae]
MKFFEIIPKKGGALRVLYRNTIWSLLVFILLSGTVAAEINAAFTGVPMSGSEPLTVSFIDQSSTNATITNYSWNFGDGSNNSSDRNSNHTYVSRGRYNVSLTVTNDIGENNTKVEPAFIHVLPSQYPVVKFTATPENGSISQIISFIDQSELDPSVPAEMYTYIWDFGDGTTDSSNTHNTCHAYTSSGSYSASLQIQDQTGKLYDSSTPVTITISNQSAFSALFAAVPPSGPVPLSVSFIDQSVSPVSIASYAWNFGDGSENSTEQNPVHTYQGAGKYNVSLTIANADGANAITTKSAYIHAQPSRYPSVQFTAVPQSGTPSDVIYFIDQSELDPSVPYEMYTYIWDFGDNSTSNGTNLRNIQHVYSTPGNYTVSLQMQDQVGAKYNSPSSVVITIANGSSSFTPSFTAAPRDGPVPLNVSFTDTSKSPVSITNYVWDFGDGSSLSKEKNPVHTYAVPGVYPVSLTVTDSNRINSTKTEPAYIHALPSRDPVVKFGVSPLNGTAPLLVHFMDKSELDPSTPGEMFVRIWNFGDGSTPYKSKEKMAEHRYSEPGTYSASLQIEDKNRKIYNSTAPATITVTNKTPSMKAQFSAVPLSGPVPLDVSFTDQSVGVNNRTEYRWDFGDKSSLSRDKNPTHTYRNPGTYSVTLSLSGPHGSDIMKKDNYIAVAPPLAHIITATASDHGSITPSGNISVPDGADQSFNITPDSGYTINNVQVDGISIGKASSHTFMKVRSDHTIQADFTRQSQTLAADFMVDKASGSTPITIQFTDKSTGSPDSWYWNFGDGSNSVKQNPVHTYTISGQFPVSLIVRTMDGRYDESKTRYIFAQ